MSTRKKKILLTVLTLVALGFGALAVKDVSFESIKMAILQFSLRDVALALFLLCLQVFGMIVRFYILMPSPRIGFMQVAAAISYGQFANAFLPARAGDVLKAVVVSQTNVSARGKKVSVMAGAGVLFADKLIDILALITTLVIFQVPTLPESKALWTWPTWVYWTLGVLLVVIIVSLKVFLPRVQSKLNHLVSQFAAGFTNLGDMGRFIGALVVAQVTWVCEAFAIKILCQSQGFDLDWTQAFFVLAILNIAISAPLSVANVGPFEAGVVYGLSFFKVPAATGIAIATVHHANVVLATIIWAGGLFLWRKATHHRLRAPATA